MTERAIVLEVPDLRCETFRLRQWRIEDAPDLVEAWKDPQILTDSVAPEMRSLRDARKWISRTDVRRRAGVALDLVVADSSDDSLLGEVSLYRFDKSRRAALISWWLTAGSRGDGVATQAVNMLAEWALAGPLTAVIAEIKETNVKSRELAQRCGFDLLRAARDSTPMAFVRRADDPRGRADRNPQAGPVAQADARDTVESRP